MSKKHYTKKSWKIPKINCDPKEFIKDPRLIYLKLSPNFIYDNDLHKDFGEIVLPHKLGKQYIFDFTKFKFYNKIYL